MRGWGPRRGVRYAIAGLAMLWTLPLVADPCPEAVDALRAISGPDLAPILQAARKGKVEEALSGLASLDPGTLPEGVRAWMAGRWLEAAGRRQEALERYRRALSSALAEDARFRAARMLLEQGDPAGARGMLAGISSASGAWRESRRLLARALREEGRLEGAAVVLRDLLRSTEERNRRFPILLDLVELYVARGEIGEARAIARREWIETPGEEAERILLRLLERTGGPVGPGDRRIREVVFAPGNRLRQMARKVGSRAGSGASDPGLPALIRGLAQRQDPRGWESAAGWLVQADRDARDTRIRAVACQALGDLLVRWGRDREALEAYARASEADPDGVLRMPALFSLARAAFRAGEFRRGEEALNRLEREDRLGAPLPSVGWERARGLMIQGRFPEALSVLDILVGRPVREGGVVGGDLERWIYYRGVMRLSLGDPAGAVTEWRMVARNAPHTWYGLLAKKRMEDSGVYEDAVPDTRGMCQNALPPLWMLTLGMEREALEELDARLAAGVIPLDAREVLSRVLATSRSARARAGARRLAGQEGSVPEGLFPTPFAEEIGVAATESGLSRGLLWAVARVESGFQPKARSRKGARGLMQLLPRVAQRAAQMGLRDRSIARRWTTQGANLRLGAVFLAALLRHFQGHLPLALAAYHAGPGAARRFQRQIGHLPNDLFVDSLPFRETTGYIQAVMALEAGYRGQTGESIAILDPAARPPPDAGSFRWEKGPESPSGESRPKSRGSPPSRSW